MGILDTVKETITLIQQVDNIDLYRRMLDLQTQVVSLVEENRSLKEKLATRAQLSFAKNAYWMKETGDGPFCSRCWDADALLLRLHVTPPHNPICPKCSTLAVDPDKKPVAAPPSGGGGPHGWMA